jgi:hypothetical protein
MAMIRAGPLGWERAREARAGRERQAQIRWDGITTRDRSREVTDELYRNAGDPAMRSPARSTASFTAWRGDKQNKRLSAGPLGWPDRTPAMDTTDGCRRPTELSHAIPWRRDVVSS